MGEANPTTITLQLAYRSLKHPWGMIEDVLVKVDKFILPDDFIVLDMEENKEIPIIIGRSFLATGRALIDVKKRELRLRVQDEEVTFNVFNAIKYPDESESCFRLESLEAIVPIQVGHFDPLETSLLLRDSTKLNDAEIAGYLTWMDSFEPNKRKYFERWGAIPS